MNALGPAFQWIKIFDSDNSADQVGLGTDFAFAYGRDIPVVPYFRSGYRWNIYRMKYTYINETSRETDHGWAIPIAAGIMIPIWNGLGFQIEPCFEIGKYEDDSRNNFTIYFGVCGVGQHGAISALSGFPSML